MKPALRVMLCDDAGERFFGEGPCRLLHLIEETGSLRSAAAQMGLSYSKALRLVQHAEKELGFALTCKTIGGRGGGGSTLTQQLAKNELFTQEKQMARKAAEMFAARDIEDYYSKQQIFEMYAGSCYFGNQWSGVAQAAQGYFGKPTRELTRAECVVLAGLPNAPSVYAANGELARRRALVVVERMERAKKLTHTQALELRDEVSALPLW